MDTKQTVINLQRELFIARSEIYNLRKQIKSLKFSQEKAVKDLKAMLLSWQCQKCVDGSSNNSDSTPRDDRIIFKPIGVLSTPFSQKRGAPRQPSVCSQSCAKLILFNTVYSNPEHALQGLSGFSHLWILFHFDKNESKHVQAKVFPPRLNGERIGVFATRSPHRPCPVGLSLVRIDCIQGSTIFFSGVDMLDGTLVIDIKPYIPLYDDPRMQILNENKESKMNNFQFALDFQEEYSHKRESVRVPSWVMVGPQKTVNLTPEVEEQLQRLSKIHLKPVITSVLKEDPRSLYVRQHYADEIYSVFIDDLNIKCKFDDKLQCVNVFEVINVEKKVLSQRSEKE